MLSSWASCQIRKIAGCACAGNAGNVFPSGRLQRKLLVSDLDMHHGTCVTHVPWCMSGSLTYGGEENVPGIPGACAPVILRIWQEAHGSNHGKRHGRKQIDTGKARILMEKNIMKTKQTKKPEKARNINIIVVIMNLLLLEMLQMRLL